MPAEQAGGAWSSVMEVQAGDSCGFPEKLAHPRLPQGLGHGTEVGSPEGLAWGKMDQGIHDPLGHQSKPAPPSNRRGDTALGGAGAPMCTRELPSRRKGSRQCETEAALALTGRKARSTCLSLAPGPRVNSPPECGGPVRSVSGSWPSSEFLPSAGDRSGLSLAPGPRVNSSRVRGTGQCGGPVRSVSGSRPSSEFLPSAEDRSGLSLAPGPRVNSSRVRGTGQVCLWLPALM
ncbi:hypothetical protein P7K49_026106 [Saguinus oedipus]|uniref:Uncharacterized protein n=1 Tax=Saguinus oedipus TaxID=9490 RepID=A0ABQ9ULF5_SAGOE|nr:hypothetical protein P7K49_026106 [Saguinus oedipus]